VKLIDDVKNAPRFWSVRLAVLSAALTAVELTLPMFSQVVPNGVFASLSMLVAIGAAVARTVKQESLL